MPDEAAKNPIEDSLSQTIEKVFGDTPPTLAGNLLQAMAQNIGIQAQNAVANQQAMNGLGQAIAKSAAALFVTKGAQA